MNETAGASRVRVLLYPHEAKRYYPVTLKLFMREKPARAAVRRQTRGIREGDGRGGNMAQSSMKSSPVPATPHEPCALDARLFATRQLSLELAQPLSAEDMTVQAMDDASPTKWHLAHTSWFFETFVLSPYLDSYETFDPVFNYCFNSYYESQGPCQPRPRRGLLTRPSCERIFAYRAHVDAGLERLFARGIEIGSELALIVEVGINHEQQHQELILTDLLALFAANPLRPANLDHVSRRHS
jgi:hypothetical protein